MKFHYRIGVRRVGIAVDAADLGPIGVQLFGEDHRQTGLHALTEVEAVDGDGDDAITVDLHERRRLLRGVQFASGCCTVCLLRQRSDRKHAEREARGGGHLEEGAAGEWQCFGRVCVCVYVSVVVVGLNGAKRVVEGVHGACSTFVDVQAARVLAASWMAARMRV